MDGHFGDFKVHGIAEQIRLGCRGLSDRRLSHRGGQPPLTLETLRLAPWCRRAYPGLTGRGVPAVEATGMDAGGNIAELPV